MITWYCHFKRSFELLAAPFNNIISYNILSLLLLFDILPSSWLFNIFNCDPSHKFLNSLITKRSVKYLFLIKNHTFQNCTWLSSRLHLWWIKFKLSRHHDILFLLKWIVCNARGVKNWAFLLNYCTRSIHSDLSIFTRSHRGSDNSPILIVFNANYIDQ